MVKPCLCHLIRQSPPETSEICLSRVYLKTLVCDAVSLRERHLKDVMPSSFVVKDCLTLADKHHVLTKCCMQMLKKTLSTLKDSNTHKNISCISGTISS
jgi:hypothetical protein